MIIFLLFWDSCTKHTTGFWVDFFLDGLLHLWRYLFAIFIRSFDWFRGLFTTHERHTLYWFMILMVLLFCFYYNRSELVSDFTSTREGIALQDQRQFPNRIVSDVEPTKTTYRFRWMPRASWFHLFTQRLLPGFAVFLWTGFQIKTPDIRFSSLSNELVSIRTTHEMTITMPHVLMNAYLQKRIRTLSDSASWLIPLMTNVRLCLFHRLKASTYLDDMYRSTPVVSLA